MPVVPVPMMMMIPVTEPSIVFRMRMPKGARTMHVHVRIVIIILDRCPVVVVFDQDGWSPFVSDFAFGIARPVKISREYW